VSRRAVIERVIRELASYERGSASPGERRAAEWLAEEFQDAGCGDVRVEQERAHGGYWWPLGLLNAVSALAAFLGRLPAVLVGGLASAAVYDDVGGGRLWFRRRTLPHRPTWNVIAELGDRDAAHTVVFMGHHDAAHSGLVFHPALPRIGMKLAPRLHERANQSIPIMYGTFLGPVLVALWGLVGRRSLRSAGLFFAGGATACMANIGASRVVPGANDNLSAVGALMALARELSAEPPDGSSTEFVCLECIGSPHLCIVEAEGMLRMRHYTESSRDRLARAGAEAGVELTRGLRTVAATDALIPLRAGYASCTLGGVDETKFPAEYHWESDVPDNLDWSSIEGAVEVCRRYLEG
jgi:hypothetical protein